MEIWTCLPLEVRVIGKRNKERQAPMGVYAWKIRATFRDGSIWNGQENVHGFERTYGTLTLIR